MYFSFFYRENLSILANFHHLEVEQKGKNNKLHRSICEYTTTYK